MMLPTVGQAMCITRLTTVWLVCWAKKLTRSSKSRVNAEPVSAQEYARTARLQRVVRMAETSKDWGRIAADAGYYDQAHLIGDFGDLVGLTPGAFVKRATMSL